MGTISSYRSFPDMPQRNFIQEFVEIPLLDLALKLPRNSDLLEVGCGRGIGLSSVTKRLAPAKVVGVDVDPALLDLARHDLGQAGFGAGLVLSDARSLPFADNSFDIAMSFGTLFHIAGPRLAIAEVARVLRPGGRFVNETRFAQLLAHPFRSREGSLRPADVHALGSVRSALLWSSHILEDS